MPAEPLPSLTSAMSPSRFSAILPAFTVAVRMRLIEALRSCGMELSLSKAHRALLLLTRCTVAFNSEAITAISLLVLDNVCNISSVSTVFFVTSTSPSAASGAGCLAGKMFTTLLPTNPSVPIETIAFLRIMRCIFLSMIMVTSISVSFSMFIFFTVPASIPEYLTLLPATRPCTCSNLAFST